MLACARIGAPHSVSSAASPPRRSVDRIVDADAKLVITADGGYRRGAVVGAEAGRRRGAGQGRDQRRARPGGQARRATTSPGPTSRDVWWHDAVGRRSRPTHEAEPHDAEHPLFILYTSGTTGKPKGILHTTGGYLTQVAYTHRNVFDLKPDTDVYWCAADIGWVTGHSYIVYGPLANRATIVHVRGHARHPATGAGGGRSSRSTR